MTIRSNFCLSLLGASAFAGANLLGGCAASTMSGSAQTLAQTAAPAPAAVGRPNILFILIDDMGFSDLSVMGNRKVATPNIDRLAREGVLMTQFYDAAPICSPSRAGFMTGRFPAEVSFWNYEDTRAHNAATGQADWLDPANPTLPRALHQIGYATGHFGKWHLGGGRDVGDAPLPVKYGFDESYVNWEGLGPRVVATDTERNLAKMSEKLGQGPVDELPKSALTHHFITKALDFIQRHKDQPWYVELWPDDVHSEWLPNAEQLAAVKGKGANPDEDRFFAVLVDMDKQIGKLVKTLRAEGQLDNTLIVLTSDNGPISHADLYRKDGVPPGSAKPLRGRKNSLYEGGSRQPLIVRWPRHVPAGVVDTDSVGSAVDLFPTLAAITGARGPAKPDGINLYTAWQGHRIEHRPDLFWTYGGFGPPHAWTHPGLESDRSPAFAIRSGDWKLLANGDGSDAQLYDISDDQTERHDLATARPQVTKKLLARLKAWEGTLPKAPPPGPVKGKRKQRPAAK